MPKRRRHRKPSRGRADNRFAIAVTFNKDLGIWVADRQDDVGTAERHGRGDIEIVDRRVAEGGVVVGKGAVALAENLLDGLLRAGALVAHPEPEDEAHRRYVAGETFRNLWRKAGLDRNPRSCLQEVIPGHSEMSEVAERAYCRVQLAMNALGPEAPFAVDVACRGVWPGLHALPRARQVLGRLADHFKV